MKKYVPVAGLLIKEAIVQAVLMARENNDLVEVSMNDIYMYITPKTNVDTAIRLYHLKKNMEFKMNILKRAAKEKANVYSN